MTAGRSKTQRSTWAQATAPTPDALRLFEIRRRSTGIILGAALGFSYGIVSQFVNRFALPGVPLYQPPLGPLGNSALSTLVGGGLGFLTTLTESAALGIFLGSAAGAAAVVISAMLRLGGLLGISGALVTGIVFSVPIAWLTVPVIALLRWATERQVEAFRDSASLLGRLRTPVALALIMAVLAAFELMPAAARDELQHMQTLVQAGLANPSNRPAALRAPAVRGFPPAAANYTLEWTQYDLDRFIELRPPSTYDQHTAVLARFADGYTLVCLYPTPKSEPNCGTY